MSQQREKKLKYIMHIGSKTNDPVRLFTDQLWQSVKNASEKKLSKYKSSKYKSIWDKLSVTYSKWDGFHLKCYSKLTAITSNVDKNGNTEKLVTKLMLRSAVDTVTCGNLGIFNMSVLWKEQKGTETRIPQNLWKFRSYW